MSGRSASAKYEAGVCSGRTLHLIDIENLVGKPGFTSDDVAVARARYLTISPMEEGDQVVIASGRKSAQAAMFGWPGNVCRKVKSGVDGADKALLAILEDESISARFERVVIASGDGIFTIAASKLRTAGVEVFVVARDWDSLSSSLGSLRINSAFISPLIAPSAAQTPITFPASWAKDGSEPEAELRPA